MHKETQQAFIDTFERYSDPIIKFAESHTMNKELLKCLRETDLEDHDRKLFYAIYTSLIILIVFI